MDKRFLSEKRNKFPSGRIRFAFSAHMDVVGDNSPFIPKLDGDFIYVFDRTLCDDYKPGVVFSLLLTKNIKNSSHKHGGFESQVKSNGVTPSTYTS